MKKYSITTISQKQSLTWCHLVSYHGHWLSYWVIQRQRRFLKISEKMNKCLDLAVNLKRLCKIKMTRVPIVAAALGMLLRRQGKRLKENRDQRKNQIIQTTELLRSARILRRVLETWEDLLSLSLRWKMTSLN